MGHVAGGYHLLRVFQHLGGFLVFTFVQQFECQLGHGATVGVAHAHDGLVEIQAGLVQSAKLEAVHHVVVSALGVEVLDAWNSLAVDACREWGDAVGQSFCNGVVAEVDVVVVTNGDGHIDRTCPVASSQHFENHQITLVEGALSFQRDGHAVGNGVAGHHHAALAHSFLVNGHVERVGRNHVQVGILRANPVFQHVLQLKRVVAKLLACLFGILAVVFDDSLLHVRLHTDIFVGA